MSIAAAVDVPPFIAELTAGRAVVPVWQNELGGLTFRIGGDYVKWFPSEHWEIDLPGEADRMQWASAFAPVPEVVDAGRVDGGQWLRTRSMDAESAAHPSNAGDPLQTVTALGRGLRWWHDTMPMPHCPYRWDVRQRLQMRGMEQTPVGQSFLDATATMEDDLVVCHGDACNPNFLVRSEAVVGYVDLGSVGIGDRWADLAAALMSLTWNFGRGWKQTFLDAYEIELNDSKVDYYWRLWELA